MLPGRVPSAHTAPDTHVLKATGPSLQTNRVNHLFQVAVGWKISLQEDHPKGRYQKAKGLPKGKGNHKATDTSSTALVL